MSIIKPFKGFRPPVDIVEKLASRPYDVLNSEEARVECEGNPYSLLHVTKAEIDLPKGTDEHSPEVYLQVVKNYNLFKDPGCLRMSSRSCRIGRHAKKKGYNGLIAHGKQQRGLHLMAQAPFVLGC